MLPAPGESGKLFIGGGAGRIEALAAVPAGRARGLAVVCHPHPLHGGAMTNKVAYALANAASKQGLVALRFNFRGVGGSEGTHDNGSGEADDTVAVVEWLRVQQPGLPLLLAGFSFGAFVALEAAHRTKPELLISIAPPFRYYDGVRPKAPGMPWLIVHARDDDVVAYDDTEQAIREFNPAPQFVSLDEGGHFFHGRIVELQTLCSGFIDQNLPVAVATEK